MAPPAGPESGDRGLSPSAHPRTRRPGRRWLSAALAGLAAVAVAAAAWLATAVGDAQPVPSTVLAVSTQRVERVPGYRVRRAFVGSIRAARSTALAFDLAGRVEWIGPEDGESVDAGAVVARLETDRLQARHAELEAALAAARARLSQARNGDERLWAAHTADADAVGALALEDSGDRLAAARAELERVRQQRRRVALDLEKSALRAPFDALVTRRHLDPGAVVSAGGAVVSLVERATREARIGFAAPVADALQPGRRYPIETGGRVLEGQLQRLMPVEDGRLRTVEALFVLPDDAVALRPGQLATVAVELDYAEPGFWLPLPALTASVRGLWAVYAAEPMDAAPAEASHRLVRHEIEVLHEQDSRVYVRSTLPERARIVNAGVQRLTPGQAVRLAGEG